MLFLIENSSLTANGSQLCMDYHDGKYGINTDPQRGADTFIPFKSDLDFTIQSATSSSSTSLTVNVGEGYELGKNLFYEITSMYLVGYNGSPISFSGSYTNNNLTITCSSNGQVSRFNARIYKAVL